MAQVIIFQAPNGNVAVCTPTGEVPIADILKNDAPAGAIIVDELELPQGDDVHFFDAWRLSGKKVSVDLTASKAIAAAKIDGLAYGESKHRSAKVGAGLSNVLADADWLALLSTARTAITRKTNSTELLAAIAPVEQAINANK